jgi:hypothetical protein
MQCYASGASLLPTNLVLQKEVKQPTLCRSARTAICDNDKDYTCLTRASGARHMERGNKRLKPDAMLARAVGRLGPLRDGPDGTCECSACAGDANDCAYAGSIASTSAGSGVGASIKLRRSKKRRALGTVGGVSTDGTERMRSPAGAGQRTHSAAGGPCIVPGSGAGTWGRRSAPGSRIELAREIVNVLREAQPVVARLMRARLRARARPAQEPEREHGCEREVGVRADRGERAFELPLEVARALERVRVRWGAQRVRARAPQRRKAVASTSVRALDALARCTCRAGPRADGSGIDGRAGGSGIDKCAGGNGRAGHSSGGVSSSSSSTMLCTSSDRPTKRRRPAFPHLSGTKRTSPGRSYRHSPPTRGAGVARARTAGTAASSRVHSRSTQTSRSSPRICASTRSSGTSAGRPSGTAARRGAPCEPSRSASMSPWWQDGVTAAQRTYEAQRSVF